MDKAMKLLICVLVVSAKLGTIKTDCTDIYGRSITPNTHFIPGPDMCQLCVCDSTTPKWCKRVLCSPPPNCKSFVMGSSCCDYSCLDDTLPSGELRDEIDRRFIITVATAFLILTIILFIIHKFRHRTVHGRLPARPINEERRSMGSIGFIGGIGYLNLPNAHHFDDHSLVHFPMYKPNTGYFPRGEAPPPYDEAMADARLASYAEIEIITNERGVQEVNQQRRRSNLNANQSFNQPRLGADAYGAFQSRLAENIVYTEESGIPNNCVTQHRTIPMPLCVNADQANNTLESMFTNVGHGNRSCSLHKKNNVNCKPEVDQYRSRANSTNQRQSCGPAMVSQSHLGATLPSEMQHRTLPLSASLSSPLPSTSDADSPNQFQGVSAGPTSSSAANICSSTRDEQIPKVTPTSKKTHHHKSCKKSTQLTIVDVVETQPGMSKSVKEQKNRNSSAKEHTQSNKELKEENQETCKIVEDYYAECENCNLNVDGDVCDGSDKYFAKQETMTLQRKLHEGSSVQTMDKVSLTLPTNSKSHRRCSSKNRKCGVWKAKESPFKTTLEYVSSESEDESIENATKIGCKEDAGNVERLQSQELSSSGKKSMDENEV